MTRHPSQPAAAARNFCNTTTDTPAHCAGCCPCGASTGARAALACSDQPTATSAHPPTPCSRLAAVELLLQQLVFVLDARGTLPADTLHTWLDIAAGRMAATGSAPACEVQALQALAARVCA